MSSILCLATWLRKLTHATIVSLRFLSSAKGSDAYFVLLSFLVCSCVVICHTVSVRALCGKYSVSLRGFTFPRCAKSQTSSIRFLEVVASSNFLARNVMIHNGEVFVADVVLLPPTLSDHYSLAVRLLHAVQLFAIA